MLDMITLHQAAFYVIALLVLVILGLILCLLIVFIINVFNFFQYTPDILRGIKAESQEHNKNLREILRIYHTKGEPCLDELLTQIDEEIRQREMKKFPRIIT